MVTQNAGNIPTGAAGKILQGAGIGTAPAFSTPTYPSASGSTGVIIKSDGTNNVYTSGFTLDSTGRMQNTSQVAFAAYCSGNILNVTGDNTAYTILFDSTNCNIGSGFNTGTGVFTAPIAGNYLFTVSVLLFDFTSSHTAWDMNLKSSGTSLIDRITSINAAQFRNGSNFCAQSGSYIVPMALNDTMFVSIAVFLGTKVVDVVGGQATYFSGVLIS